MVPRAHVGRIAAPMNPLSADRRNLRWPGIALGALVVVSTALILYMNRGTTFWVDELFFFQNSKGLDPNTLLAPHNGQLVLVARLIYAGLFEAFGPDYTVFRIVAALGVAAVGCARLPPCAPARRGHRRPRTGRGSPAVRVCMGRNREPERHPQHLLPCGRPGRAAGARPRRALRGPARLRVPDDLDRLVVVRRRGVRRHRGMAPRHRPVAPPVGRRPAIGSLLRLVRGALQLRAPGPDDGPER